MSYADALVHWCHAPGKKLIAFDFDGTLAPNVKSPNDPTGLPCDIAQKVETLSSYENVCFAVISGRGFPTLYEIFGLRKNIIFAGNHGFEIHSEHFDFIDPSALLFSKEIETCMTELKEKLKEIPLLDIEEKGYSGAIFYKNTPVQDHEEIHQIAAPVLEKYSHIHVLQTFGVYEICPRVNWHKGRAALWLSEKLNIFPSNIFFAGDEVNDEPAFETLTEGFTLKIGPQPTAARFQVAQQTEVRKILDIMLENLN